MDRTVVNGRFCRVAARLFFPAFSSSLFTVACLYVLAVFGGDVLAQGDCLLLLLAVTVLLELTL